MTLRFRRVRYFTSTRPLSTASEAPKGLQRVRHDAERDFFCGRAIFMGKCPTIELVFNRRRQIGAEIGVGVFVVASAVPRPPVILPEPECPSASRVDGAVLEIEPGESMRIVLGFADRAGFHGVRTGYDTPNAPGNIS